LLGLGRDRASSLESKLELTIKEEPAEYGDSSDEQASTSGVATPVRARTQDSQERDSRAACISIKEETDYSADLCARSWERLRRLQLLRSWTKTGLGRELEAGQRLAPPVSLQFRVLSYNILDPSILRRQPHLFSKRPAAVLEWGHRLRGLLREIDDLRPDIVCLQEVPFSSPTTVQADLANCLSQRGYTYRGRRRCVADGRRSDGCAIFYRAGLFTLDTWKAVETVEEGGNRHRVVGVICRLQPVDVQLPTRLVVATVHLRHGQKHFVSRLADMQLFLAGM
jgi:hypothetical protein